MVESAVIQTDLEGLNLLSRGKVRDIYDLGDALLMVASDRISAFDVVMDEPVPDKGKVLTKMSVFWFKRTKELVTNHLITANAEEFPEVLKPFSAQISERSMLVKKAEPLAVECVVRGYLAGSGVKDYLEFGTVCGIKLPGGLKESEKLPEPIFTPSTKAERGLHDINISFEEAASIVGKETAERVKDISIKLYLSGADMALERGIIIADTKFEFGLLDGELILIDEVLTPDSSRFWPADEYEPGRPQNSFDKQFLRDYLNSLDWGKAPPPPKLPAEIIAKTRARYLKALEIITGERLK